MKSKYLLLVLIVSLSMIVGCSPSEEGNTENSIVLSDEEWVGVDIWQTSTQKDTQTIANQSLFVRDDDGNILPNMGKSYEISEDGKTITVELADDLMYHDGTLVTPEDVKRSFEHGLEAGLYASFDIGALESISVEGNNVMFHLSEFSPTVLLYLSEPLAVSIIPATQLDSMSTEELLWGATTYGQYYLEEYVEGSYVTLKRNEHYKTYNPLVENKGPGSYETITIRFMSDPFAISQSLIAGDVGTGIVRNETINDLRNAEHIDIQSSLTFELVRLTLNNDFHLFQDPEVRLALGLLLNREALSEYSDGFVSPGYSYSVEGMLDYSDKAAQYYKDTYTNDPDRGMKILEDKGWIDSDDDGYLDKDGEIFEFELSNARDYLEPTVENLQIMLKEYGIKMNISSVERTVHDDLVDSDEYEAGIETYNWPDTASTLPSMLHDVNLLDNNEYQEACAYANSFTNKEERVEEYFNVQKMLMDTGCSIPLVISMDSSAFNTNVINGYVITKYGTIYYNDIK